MGMVTPSVSSRMVPLRADPDWVHWSVKWPWLAPLYCPVQFPDRPLTAAGADELAAGVPAVGVLAAAAAAVDVPALGAVPVVWVAVVLALLEHAASVIASAVASVIPGTSRPGPLAWP
jgi:hypothetical protein